MVYTLFLYCVSQLLLFLWYDPRSKCERSRVLSALVSHHSASLQCDTLVSIAPGVVPELVSRHSALLQCDILASIAPRVRRNLFPATVLCFQVIFRLQLHQSCV